jgi:prepilin-type N-terminal cleavage/methylation domain-containing protein
MKQRGLSVVELLIVITIVCVLSSVGTSAFISAKKAGKQTRSIESMRQIYTGALLYQADYTEGVTYGDPSAMGLPNAGLEVPVPTPFYGLGGINVPQSITKNSCSYDPGYPWTTVLTYYFHVVGYDYAPMVEQLEDRTPIVMDLSCGPEPSTYTSPFNQRTVFAIALGGQLMRRRSCGNPNELDFWKLSN